MDCYSFLEKFIEALSKGCDFLILRSYEELPYKRSGDVDILIRKKDYKLAIRLLQSFQGVKVIQYLNLYNVKAYLVLCEETGDLFKLDFHLDEEWWGIEYLPTQYFFENARRFKSFWVPDRATQVFLILLEGLLWGGKVPKKWRGVIQESLAEEGFLKHLRPLFDYVFGKKLSSHLIFYLERQEFDEMEKLRPRLIFAFIMRSLFHRPFRTFYRFTSFILQSLGRYIVPPGKMVVVEGLDGSGKTTLSQFALEKLRNRGVPAIYFHWRPNLFPQLSELFYGKNSAYDDRGNLKPPHSAPPSSRISSIFRVLYYALDFILGYYVKVRPLLSKRYVVVFDRYFYDMYLDPLRSRLKGVDRFTLFLSLFIPKPAGLIFVDANYEKILERKPELTLDAMKEIRERFGNFRKKVKFPILIVENNGTLESAQKEFLASVYNLLR